MTTPTTRRTVLVTGATGGIGQATARGLAALGAAVAITGRDARRTHDAAESLRALGARVIPFVADLSSQAEVRRLANEVLDRLGALDVLVNNAGGYWSTRRTTRDGLEHTLAVNHLAPFLLTRLLLDRLRDGGGGRIVTVASNAQSMGRIDFDDLQGERSYSGSRAYNQSKLANVLFTVELARRLEGTTVTANALHPGVVSTRFGAEDPGAVQRLLVPLIRPLMLSPEKGAATSVYLASSPDVAATTGRFFAGGRVRRRRPRADEPAVARRLWQVSSQLVGLPESL
jgi:retinol dehydrogenase-14